jgi:surface antigen
VSAHTLADNPDDTWGQTIARLCFFIGSLLAAACLLLLALSLHGSTNTLSSSLHSNAGRLVQGMRDELLASANAATYLSGGIARVTNLHALIRPADYTNPPVITAPPVLATAATPAQPVATAQSVTIPASVSKLPTNNSYAWGNCTWWAAARRAQLGDAIPGTWGNAATWAARAARDGYRVDHTPAPGAIMQTARAAGGLGHVAVVEQVDPDGSWHISEMNVIGLNIVDHATRSSATAASFNFIHDHQ